MNRHSELAVVRHRHDPRPGPGWLARFLAVGVVVLLTPVARAGLVFSVNDVTAAAGSLGNTTLEVSLTNTGPVATPRIAAFQFQLTVPGAAGVTFTDADIQTANHAYIFGTNSLAPPLSFDTFPNTAFTASDVYAIPNDGVTLDAGQSVGLGRVTFDVAASAGGVVPVLLVENFTDSLLDPAGAPIADTYGFVDGSVTVVTSTPEPSSVVLGLLAMAGLSVGRVRPWQWCHCGGTRSVDRSPRLVDRC
jgi:hypothetical protein